MPLKAFEKHQYLNLETFRKNGQGVKTPVWFAQEGDALYIWTQANSGKAKRVRRKTPVSVNIAPCRGDGHLLGEWVPAHATHNDLPEAIEHVRKLMVAKYGIMFHAFALIGKLRKATNTTLKITAE